MMSKHIYDAIKEAKHVLTSVNNSKIMLPESSTRKSYGEYEEIVVNSGEKAQIIPPDSLISIRDNFDPVGQIAFKGCTHLNQMQSIVFDEAYKTNKNLLVAAPTGSGKTNVAMMCVLHELKNYFKPGTTKLISEKISQKFKIIYIAPMKSLATEQTDLFNTRLKELGIKAKELTGDMSLTENEMAQTHIIVTTPEKWDIVTRKSKGEVDLLSLVRLLIIDEVHLLQSDRGPVLEAIVARTLRYVESSQRMTRVVGLSATLPNYVDVAALLKVNPNDGLFYFDSRFRPVPLKQTFVGVRSPDSKTQAKTMDNYCFKAIVHYAQLDKQVMIFVHTRNSTKNVAMKLKEMIQFGNKLELFQPDITKSQEANRLMANPKNSVLKQLFEVGFGIHHAGMVRADRLLVEKLFRMKALKVLVCTSTLAWGVNFPAHAVLIRGTDIYDSAAGKFVDVGLLDVTQIFGRAGRPQFDTEGHAYILTGLDKMDHYLKLLTNQTPIESNFIKYLTDNLNAEVVAGTVSNMVEANEWLSYTYLNVRIKKNPLVYGFDKKEVEIDPSLTNIRRELLKICARQLDEALMCRYDSQSGRFEATVLGRIASHFYINFETVTKYNEKLSDSLDYNDVFSLIGEAQEFQQIKFREEERQELDNLRRRCQLPLLANAIETTSGKVNCLLQAYINKTQITSHSLLSDVLYIAQNSMRIARGLFEYCLKQSWSVTALTLLRVCKMLEQQQWHFQTPLRHFQLPDEVIYRIENSKLNIGDMLVMNSAAIAKVINYPEKMGQTVKNFINHLPYILVDGSVKPISSSLVNIVLTVQPYFKWNERYHGQTSHHFWLWVYEDEITHQILYSDLIRFSKEQIQNEFKMTVNIKLPLVENTFEDGSIGQRLPNSYTINVVSESWNCCDYVFSIDCHSVFLPEETTEFTKQHPNLMKLKLDVLGNETYFDIFRRSSAQSNHSRPLNILLDNFNLLQSHVFFPLFHSDRTILFCAPPGSGKTLLSDIAMIRVFEKHTKGRKHKIIYVSPMANFARFKLSEWRDRICRILKKRAVIFQNTHLDQEEFDSANIVIMTYQNFYSWINENPNSEEILSKQISLIIFDDLQFISQDPKVELAVASLKIIQTKNPRVNIRILGLSNTTTNYQEIGNWLGVKKEVNNYNFCPNISRPIQMVTHIIPFTERFYNPRMSVMNRQILKAILDHSPDSPVIVFVPTTKQCNLTARELVSCIANLNDSSSLKILDHQMLSVLKDTVIDEDLKLTMQFGVGILHSSLDLADRKTVEELFTFNKIQILICTQEYCDKIQLRARLVIIKGTEKLKPAALRTELLEQYSTNEISRMLSCAGRPNIDSVAIAMLFIWDIFEEFYQMLTHKIFPTESCLLDMSENDWKEFLFPVNDTSLLEQQFAYLSSQATSTKSHKNSIKSFKKKYCRNKLEKTLLYSRVLKNQSYYGMKMGQSRDKFFDNILDSFGFMNSI